MLFSWISRKIQKIKMFFLLRRKRREQMKLGAQPVDVAKENTEYKMKMRHLCRMERLFQAIEQEKRADAVKSFVEEMDRRCGSLIVLDLRVPKSAEECRESIQELEQKGRG